MKQCAFTIVAKNYIGLGLILCQSLRKHNPEINFRIFVADEFEDKSLTLPSEVTIAKDAITNISAKQWIDMAFKYNLTEFCTAIKPFCFEVLFKESYDKVYYFDPDIYIFSPINDICDALNDHSITLTPHVCGIHHEDDSNDLEWTFNVNGIFNLGFCGIKNDDLGNRIVAWWEERLRDNCFTDRSIGNFTDQKWMDWIPGFCGTRLKVQHSLGMNLAPWNFFERAVQHNEDDTFTIHYRKQDNPERNDTLVFVHFAGYDYKQLRNGIVSRIRLTDLLIYNDIEILQNIYHNALIANVNIFDHYISQPYSYNAYDDGTPIAEFQRRLYHGIKDKEAIGNPFSTGKGTYYTMIKKLGMVSASNIDKMHRSTMNDLPRKERLIAIMYKCLFKLVGYKRYTMFLKSHYFYCRPELHTFLIHKQ